MYSVYLTFHPPFCYTIFQKAGSSFFQSKLGVDRFQTHYRKLDFFSFCSSNSNKELIPYYVDIYVYKTSSIVLIGGILAVLRVILSDESGYKKFGILGLIFAICSTLKNHQNWAKQNVMKKIPVPTSPYSKFHIPKSITTHPRPSLFP